MLLLAAVINGCRGTIASKVPVCLCLQRQRSTQLPSATMKTNSGQEHEGFEQLQQYTAQCQCYQQRLKRWWQAIIG
jgi:hypothetical protein